MSGYTVDENSKAVYGAIFDQMNTLHEQGNEKSAAEAEAIAIDLVAHADLPLLYRTHAHMVLGCGNRDDFLWHAQEAVRIVDKGIEWFGASTTSSALLSAAQDVLNNAKRDHDQLEKIKTERGKPRAGNTCRLARSRPARRSKLSSMAKATVSFGRPRLA
jgi:hypothetical protein